jgi:4-aminobutyrate aminotransferase-like enzyme
LVCAASIAVLDVIEEQNLMANASKVETFLED